MHTPGRLGVLSSQNKKFSFYVQNVRLRFVLVVVTCGQSQRVWRVAADV